MDIGDGQKKKFAKDILCEWPLKHEPQLLYIQKV